MGIFGDFLGGGVSGAKRAKEAIQNVKIPEASDLRLQLERLVQQGILTPAQFESILAPDTEFDSIQEDPALRAAQAQALAEYQEIANSEGLDASTQAALNDIQNQMFASNRGAQQAIMENAAARGQAGSGLEFVNRLIAQQEAATRANATGVDAAALAEQRKDAARAAAANLAGGIREADFGVNASRAAAQDAINRLNQATRQSTSNLNVQTANQAQASNLGERQRVADTNVGLSNEQQRINKLETPLALTDLQMRKAGALANAQNNLGQAREARADRGTQLIQQVGNSIMGAFGGAGSVTSDERVKRNVRPLDSRKLLEDISGYRYNYSDPDLGTEPEVGVMAQDVERVAPAVVHETAGGVKEIDTGKMGGLILAALADMNRRVSEMEDKDGVR